MYSKILTPLSTGNCSEQTAERQEQDLRRKTERIAEMIENADGILIGGGSGAVRLCRHDLFRGAF